MAKKNKGNKKNKGPQGGGGGAATQLNIQQSSGGGGGNRSGGGNRGGGGASRNLSIRQGNQVQPQQYQRAPYPQAFIDNPPPGAVQYIEGLMVPGNESLGYRPEYGGAGYAAGGADGVDVDRLKTFYRAMAATGNKAIGLGSWNDIYAAAAGYDPANFGGASSSGGGGGSNGASAALTGAMQLKDAKNLGQAIRIAGGGRGNITNKERLQIGRQFKVGDDKVIRRLDEVNSKRRSKGKASYALGGNAFNKLASGDPTLNYGTGAIGQAVRGGMPKMYGNQNSSRGMTNPLQVRKGVSVTGLTAKGDIDTRERLLGSGSFNRPQMKATDTASGTTGTGTGTSTGTGGVLGMVPQNTEQSTENLGPGGLYGGGTGALGATRLGRAKSRLRKLGIYGEGTNLLSRGLQYGININK